MTATATAPRVAARRPRVRNAAAEAHRLVPRPLLLIITVALCAFVLVPILYIVLASLNTDIGVAEGQFWPGTFSGTSYTRIWTTADLARGLVNSIVVCGCVAVASALLGT